VRAGRPGDRLLLENGSSVAPGTLGGFAKHGDKFWGVTAGHVFRGFSNHQRVWYFPFERELLGTYDEPAITTSEVDLAKFEVPRDLALFAPIGYPTEPTLFPHGEIQSLQDQSVVFLGGQIGRVLGRVTRIGSEAAYTQAIVVRLQCPDLREGNSGGPLYRQTPDSLEWVGTLVAGRQLGSGFSEGLFLHPEPGLAALGIA
jgi:hypothetical protein